MTKWTKAKQDEVRAKYKREVLMGLHAWIDTHAEDILDMADARHENGFEKYGDEMYEWDKRTLFLNMMEEIADFVNYGCGGRGRGWSL